jgi:hypothetical protein
MIKRNENEIELQCDIENFMQFQHLSIKSHFIEFVDMTHVNNGFIDMKVLIKRSDFM